MATFIALVCLVIQTQYTTAFRQQNFGNDNDLDDLGYSDYDYELPKFWEDKFSILQTRIKPVERQKPNVKQKPTNNAKTTATAAYKSFRTTKATVKTTRPVITTTAHKYKFDVSKLYFPSLESYEVLALPVPDHKYPWIAKVVHSRTESYPYMCTAVCIEQRIFITAARCIATLKVSITSVIYEKVQFLVKVFISPDKPTKQLFDDIGLIVVYDNNVKYQGKWPAVKLFDGKRKGDNFEWFEDLNYNERLIQHKVIGYTIAKRLFKFKQPQTEFRLTELSVVVDINICEQLFSKGNIISRYHVPCYHFCNRTAASKCTSYLGTEGAAVYNFKTNKLLGLATWGLSSSTSYDLPVGFSVPNSDNFYKDLACARKLKADRNARPEKGYYQTLCDNKS